jgi:hypothetical protein
VVSCFLTRNFVPSFLLSCIQPRFLHSFGSFPCANPTLSQSSVGELGVEKTSTNLLVSFQDLLNRPQFRLRPVASTLAAFETRQDGRVCQPCFWHQG